MGAKADETVRMATYMAISTDTGSFMYSNTQESTLLLFSRLVAEGLPLAQIDVYKRQSQNRS